MPIVTVPDTDELNAAFEPYLSALGRVAHAWNRFQERLARLFVQVREQDRKVALDDWYSVNSDRRQREKLKAAVAASAPDRWAPRLPLAREDMLWMLDEADRLALLRNVAIHAPCELAVDADQIVVMASYFQGNPRANDLMDKDIIAEFLLYERSASVLTVMVEQMESALISTTYPWPDRPTLPAPGDIKFAPYRRRAVQN
jgi:hypothetical protein